MGPATRGVSESVAAARSAVVGWSERPTAERVRFVRRLRFEISERAERLAAAASGSSKGFAETLASEVLPLADACRFLELESAAILAPKTLSRRARPLWARDVDVRLVREPWGVVLVVAPSNYPLFLPGVQALHALVAGNAVVVKPGPGGSDALREFRDAVLAAGLPDDVLHLLDEDSGSVTEALAAGVDHVVLTGSESTGRAVLGQLAPRLVPGTLELSGADPIVALPGSDPSFVAKAVAFGLAWNGGATCIAPRRWFHERRRSTEFEAAARDAVARRGGGELDPRRAAVAGEVVREALGQGARVVVGGLDADGRLVGPTVLADVRPELRAASADLFAPVVAMLPYDDLEDAVAQCRACRYALGASVFGPPREARMVASRISAGVVVINDVIVPTADPRVPFGGRGASGYGTTRGAEGLLAMTRPKAVAMRSGRFRPHLDPVLPGDEQIFLGTLRMAHSRTLAGRVRSAAGLVRVLARRGMS